MSARNAFLDPDRRGEVRDADGAAISTDKATPPGEIGVLGADKRTLGAVMRRMPVRIRKVGWWWMQLYERIGGGGFSENPRVDGIWPQGLQAPVRCTHHPYRVSLNLRDWLERRAYFSGMLYQWEIEALLKSVLRPGDQFIDIGANIGLVTLLGAHCVGSTGRVIACEPNPQIFARLKDHVTLNGLSSRVRLVQSAIGDAPGQAVLSMEGAHAGKGTLTGGSEGVEVPVATGDDAFAEIAGDRPLVIKMDIEGFEARALAGMTGILSHPNAALVIEVSRVLLARIGDSAQDLYDRLRAAGFTAFVINATQQRFTRGAVLIPSSRAETPDQYDALFVKIGSPLHHRLVEAKLIGGKSENSETRTASAFAHFDRGAPFGHGAVRHALP